MTPLRTRLLVAMAGGAAALTLTGCGTVTDAVSQGQQALDSAQGLLDAGAQLGAACAAAQAAWLPGIGPEDAYAAIDEATALVNEAVTASPGIPGATEIDQALQSARAAIGADETAFGVARSTLQTACAIVSLGS